jgi:F-type H+-transporting ATPase subunit delta
MPPVADRRFALARVYAEALLDVADERGAAEEVAAELEELRRYAAVHPDFAAFLSSPAVDDEARRDVCERLLRGRVSDLAVDALQVVNRKGRLGLLPTIAEAYSQALDERRGRIAVGVESARPLDDDQRRRLVQAVARHTGKQARLREAVRPELIGGLVLRIGDRKIDNSVASRLAALAEALRARASAEIWSGRDYARE